MSAYAPATGQRRLEFTPLASRVESKRRNRRTAMLERLLHGPATTLELLKLGGSGFSSRLREIRRELRAEGKDVRCTETEDGGTYEVVKL